MTVSAVLRHPEQYDGKVIDVVGKIAAYQERATRWGDTATTFRLEDGGSSVTVYFFGKPLGLKNGQRARVIGTYSAIHHDGQYTFRNQLGAQQIQALP
jgi:hypothetical protein